MKIAFVAPSLALLVLAGSLTVGAIAPAKTVTRPSSNFTAVLECDANAQLLTQAHADWWVVYNSTRGLYPDQGVRKEGVIYRWTGEIPIKIKMVSLGSSNGEDVLVPDPVEYAMIRASTNWLDTGISSSAATLPGPSDCNAKLVKGPPPSLGFRFVCEQECGSGISCLSSQPQPPMGYCSCGGGGEPSYCHGTFTYSGGSWLISCDGGPCAVPTGCDLFTTTDSGFELHWCKCK